MDLNILPNNEGRPKWLEMSNQSAMPGGILPVAVNGDAPDREDRRGPDGLEHLNALWLDAGSAHRLEVSCNPPPFKQLLDARIVEPKNEGVTPMKTRELERRRAEALTRHPSLENQPVTVQALA